MDLRTRLRKIATGTTVAEAIESYLKSVDAGEGGTDEEKQQVEELLATIEVMFLMAAVDGNVADDEVEQLRASLEALVDTKSLPRLDLDRTLSDLAIKLAKQGWSSRLHDATRRIVTKDGRAFAFRLAAGVAFVDDFVAHAEAAAIDALGTALGMDKRDTQAILEDVHETLFG
jgi:hypothetical protein